jgi:hypothetical protein
MPVLPALLLALIPMQETTPRVQDEAPVRPENRVLFCRGGAVLRGLTRPLGTSGAWEIRRDGKWIALHPGLVLSSEMEKDSEKEYARQLGAARKQAADKRSEALAKAAGWALKHGLLKEGIRELDGLLAKDCDLLPARNAVCAHAMRFPVPALGAETSGPALGAALDKIFAWGSEVGPALRELTVVEMAKVRDRKAILKGLTAELGARDARRRGLASLGLRRLFPGKSVRPLILHATLDPDRDVRASTARTLAAAGDQGVILPLVRSLDSSHPTLRQRSAEALGRMQYPAAVEPLVRRLRAAAQPSAAAGGNLRPIHSYIFVGTQFAYLQDFDVEIAMGSSIADPVVNVLTSGTVLDVGVISVGRVHFARETRAIRVALGQLTGADPGNTNRAWLEWWEENGEAWHAERVLKPAPSTPGTTTTGTSGKGARP